MINVVHVIAFIGEGGATQAMMALAKYSPQNSQINHAVLSLQPNISPSDRWAHDAGLTLLDRPTLTGKLQALAQADVVHLHFWNTPGIYHFLSLDLPPMRLVIWAHVSGEPPQSIPPSLIDFADIMVAGSPHTYANPVFQTLPPTVKSSKTTMINAGSDWSRLQGLRPRHHPGFNVGCMTSTITSGKIHPQYIPMSASIEIPDLQFIVCGSINGHNLLAEQADQLGVSAKFDFRGYVLDIKPVLEILDVYGFPLSPHTSAGSELNLQEAMYAGIPPVVFPYANVKWMVTHGQTGLVAHSALEYKQAIEYLYHHPQERQRLGQNAHQVAKSRFGADRAAQAFTNIYRELMRHPKRQRTLKGPQPHNSPLRPPEPAPPLSGADWFIYALGQTVPHFAVSRTSSDPQEILTAEQAIAQLPDLMCRMVGGIVSYRSYYPDDGYLYLWHGLMLQYQGQHQAAITAFRQAKRMGLTPSRIDRYLEQCDQALISYSSSQAN